MSTILSGCINILFWKNGDENKVREAFLFEIRAVCVAPHNEEMEPKLEDLLRLYLIYRDYCDMLAISPVRWYIKGISSLCSCIPGKPAASDTFPPETEDPHYIFPLFSPTSLPLCHSLSSPSFHFMFAKTPQASQHKASERPQNLWYLKQRAWCQRSCQIGRTVIQGRNIILNQTKWINNRGCRHTFILAVHVRRGLSEQPKWLVCWQNCLVSVAQAFTVWCNSSGDLVLY